MQVMAYDGGGSRILKQRELKAHGQSDWVVDNTTHYTGIGTEVRENYRDGSLQNARVVVKSLQGERRKNKFTCFYDRAAAAYAEGVHMPQGLGRYGVEDAEKPSSGNATFEWYLKNHLGSTMLVYGTQGSSNADVANLGEVKKAYDYRSFGEQIDLIADAGDKVTENFTGKERDDETELNYFGARYLDPMLGLWINVDPARQFSSPYLYVGNGMNPVNGVDPDGNEYVGAMLNVYNDALEHNFYNSQTMKNVLTAGHKSPTKYDGYLGDYGFRGQKESTSGGGYNIFINKNLTAKERAATLVHETIEGSLFQLENGKIIQGNTQDWHARTRANDFDQFFDITYNYPDADGLPDFNLFLEANYNGTLETIFGESRPSDDVYKLEYESLNGI